MKILLTQSQSDEICKFLTWEGWVEISSIELSKKVGSNEFDLDTILVSGEDVDGKIQRSYCDYSKIDKHQYVLTEDLYYRCLRSWITPFLRIEKLESLGI